MILIFGGAYQGKLTWAVERFELKDDELWDLAQGFVPGKRCYYHLEALTRRNEPMPAFVGDVIVISREVGCGVVPMDADQRAWRENHGQALRLLARQAEQVIRVFCGMGEVLK